MSEMSQNARSHSVIEDREKILEQRLLRFPIALAAGFYLDAPVIRWFDEKTARDYMVPRGFPSMTAISANRMHVLFIPQR